MTAILGVGRVVIVLAFAALLTGSAAPAYTQDGYAISWWSVQGGSNTTSQGGEYRLAGSAGQAEAGLLAGGSYTLAGGFWAGAGGSAGSGVIRLHLPMIVQRGR